VAEALAGVPRRLWVLNKCDLLPALPATAPDTVALSVRTGEGLDGLHAQLRTLAERDGEAREGDFTARARQVDALRRARAGVGAARAQLDHGMLELSAECLREAHDALGEITGRVAPDDLLGHIFSTFCIGK